MSSPADKIRASSVSSSGGKIPPPHKGGRSGGKRKSKEKGSSAVEVDGGISVDLVKGRLHHLFDQIEKEVDLILAENVACEYFIRLSYGSRKLTIEN